ncbi:MAG: auxin efflux carrier [Candidatus Caldatribacteriota bacterium]
MSILGKIIPIFIFLFLGNLFKTKNFFLENTVEELKRFIINFSLPALLFLAFLNMQIRSDYWLIVVTIFLVNLIMLLVGKVVSPLLGLKDPYAPLLFTGFEVGMLGIPLFGAIYGVENVQHFALLDLGQEIYVWFVLLAILYYINQKSTHYVWLIKKFFSSPIIIAIILGLILNIAGLKIIIYQNYFLKGLLEALEWLSSIVIPLILIVIGYEIKFSLQNLVLPLKIVTLRTIFMLILAVIISNFLFSLKLKLSLIYHIALYSMFVLPPPFIIPLFISKEKSQPFILNTLSLGTIITLIIFTLFSFYYQILF